MSNYIIEWTSIGREIENSVYRRCGNCGKKVIFKDSGVRRENANGKNIYRWAIYKCEKGHTWNRKLKDFKAFSNMKENIAEDTPSKLYRRTHQTEEVQKEVFHKRIAIEEIKKEFTGIEIYIKDVEGPIRVDALLAGGIEDLSRSQANKMIRRGQIVVDDKEIKSSKVIKESCLIKINGI